MSRIVNMGEGLHHYLDLDKITDDSIIVDGGSGKGEFITKFREYDTCKNCVVHMIECNRTNIAHIKNITTDAEVLHEGAMTGAPAESVSFTEFVGGKYHEWGTIIEVNSSDRRRKLSNNPRCSGILDYDVEAIDINNLLNVIQTDHIDYLKMDIEGEEGNIFDYMTPATASKIYQISFEVHANVDTTKMHNRIIDLGFTMVRQDPREWYVTR